MEKVTVKDVAIVIPLSLKESFTLNEKTSLQHLVTHLGKYEKIFVVAEKAHSNHFELEGFKVKRFPDKYFGSVQAHNKLLTNNLFYTSFSEYKFILIYHLDSLVFSDQLLYWCEKDYDCIAPPWLKSEFKWLNESGVGNGGFALRKVESLIKLYSSKKYWKPPTEMAKVTAKKSKPMYWLVYPIALMFFKLKIFNNIKIHVNKYLSQHGSAEDRFIALFGNHYFPELKIAPVDEALKFAFEANPKKCFELNNNEMPFGCHAFGRYDYSFWEPHLLESKEEPVQIP